MDFAVSEEMSVRLGMIREFMEREVVPLEQVMLFGDPDDISALNGLGSILTYSRDFDAARFFIKRAIALARRAGFSYEEAKSDLKLIALAR